MLRSRAALTALKRRTSFLAKMSTLPVLAVMVPSSMVMTSWLFEPMKTSVAAEMAAVARMEASARMSTLPFWAVTPLPVK